MDAVVVALAQGLPARPPGPSPHSREGVWASSISMSVALRGPNVSNLWSLTLPGREKLDVKADDRGRLHHNFLYRYDQGLTSCNAGLLHCSTVARTSGVGYFKRRWNPFRLW